MKTKFNNKFVNTTNQGVRHHYKDRFFFHDYIQNQEAKGFLPNFSKAIGMDFVITQDKKIYLIELQHGFGRQGLLELFPAIKDVYRKTTINLRREYGKNLLFSKGLRQICVDKSLTYKLFSKYQPSSIVYHRSEPKIRKWLNNLSSDYILAKPPRQSCGKGIVVFKRDEFLEKCKTLFPGRIYLLQNYIVSKQLLDSCNKAHIGCIRHIALVLSDGNCINYIHLPSYWRVSPTPFNDENKKDAFVANISRGAFPVSVNLQDENKIKQFSEKILNELICNILNLSSVQNGNSKMLIS
jgi:hypothetical protein